MRKINRKQLEDLVNKEAQGNSGGTIEKRYFAKGKAAVREVSKQQEGEVYWPMM